jgi:CheY-like chemotaxis protein
LIGNAIKFTAQGGVKIVVDYTETSDHLAFEIAISDTGIGIPANRIDSIFEQFSQAEADTSRKFGGTGLGLSISLLLVEKMGGTIKVESVVGQGSTFKVQIKLGIVTGSVAVSATKTENADVQFLAGKRVLIAEDNKTNRLLIKKMMASTRANIEFAHDGLEVVDKCFTLKPDLILMDVSMPNQDGRAATKEIRKREQCGPRVPIIALTANAFKEDEQACFDAGMDGFLSKPIRKGKLTSELARVWAKFHD